jgi:hypothetical protein
MPLRLYTAALTTWLMLTDPKRRTERGGSNTIEILLYCALAIAIATIVTVAITGYVRSHLP